MNMYMCVSCGLYFIVPSSSSPTFSSLALVHFNLRYHIHTTFCMQAITEWGRTITTTCGTQKSNKTATRHNRPHTQKSCGKIHRTQNTSNTRTRPISTSVKIWNRSGRTKSNGRRVERSQSPTTAALIDVCSAMRE